MKHSTITFTEHEAKSIQADLGWAQNDPRLDQLERLNLQTRDDLFVLGRKSIKASQYVGLVRLGDTTLQILPKIAFGGDFDKPEDSPEYRTAVRSATRNLLVMLSVACDLPLRALESSQLQAEPGDWLEILTRLLALELHRQFRAGVPHGYVTVEERIPVIRGRWMVELQLARHAGDLTRFDVRYDDFSINTPLNRVFFLTVDALTRLTLDPYNLRLLLDIRDWISECRPRRELLETDLSKVYFSRLNDRFRPAFNLARLFWEQRLVQLSTGGVPAFAFVFDMNRLFQDYVSRFLQHHRAHILPPEWQEAEVVLQGQDRKVHLAERYDFDDAVGRPVFRLLPDIQLTLAPGFPVLIADTKYKRLSPDSADGGVNEGDAYQMLAYARRWKCSRVLMIYPASSPFPKLFVLKAIGDDATRIQIVEVNLQQPLEQPDGLIGELRLAIGRLQ